MVVAADMLKQFQKDYGTSVGGLGSKLVDRERVPTGCFEFDLATGGGLPKGLVSIIYGPESSGKTNFALKAVANHQLLWPDKVCIWMAIEAFDPEWATKMGVNVDNLIVMKPDYAEQCADMVEGFLGSADVGLIVIDSIAALVATATAQKSAEDQVMGGIGVVMSRLCDKIATELRKAEKEDRALPTILFINQIRTKVGIVFGSPLSMPGGAKQKFLSALTVRVTGKNIEDKKVSAVMPVAKETQFVLEKWKVPIIATNGKIQMAMVPHNNLAVGECHDWPSVSSMLKNLGMLKKGEKSGWMLGTQEFKLQTDCKDYLLSNPDLALKIRAELIRLSIASGGIPESSAETE